MGACGGHASVVRVLLEKVVCVLQVVLAVYGLGGVRGAVCASSLASVCLSMLSCLCPVDTVQVCTHISPLVGCHLTVVSSLL